MGSRSYILIIALLITSISLPINCAFADTDPTHYVDKKDPKPDAGGGDDPPPEEDPVAKAKTDVLEGMGLKKGTEEWKETLGKLDKLLSSTDEGELDAAMKDLLGSDLLDQEGGKEKIEELIRQLGDSPEGRYLSDLLAATEKARGWDSETGLGKLFNWADGKNADGSDPTDEEQARINAKAAKWERDRMLKDPTVQALMKDGGMRGDRALMTKAQLSKLINEGKTEEAAKLISGIVGATGASGRAALAKFGADSLKANPSSPDAKLFKSLAAIDKNAKVGSLSKDQQAFRAAFDKAHGSRVKTNSAINKDLNQAFKGKGDTAALAKVRQRYGLDNKDLTSTDEATRNKAIARKQRATQNISDFVQDQRQKALAAKQSGNTAEYDRRMALASKWTGVLAEPGTNGQGTLGLDVASRDGQFNVEVNGGFKNGKFQSRPPMDSNISSNTPGSISFNVFNENERNAVMNSVGDNFNKLAFSGNKPNPANKLSITDTGGGELKLAKGTPPPRPPGNGGTGPIPGSPPGGKPQGPGGTNPPGGKPAPVKPRVVQSERGLAGKDADGEASKFVWPKEALEKLATDAFTPGKGTNLGTTLPEGFDNPNSIGMFIDGKFYQRSGQFPAIQLDDKGTSMVMAKLIDGTSQSKPVYLVWNGKNLSAVPDRGGIPVGPVLDAKGKPLLSSGGTPITGPKYTIAGYDGLTRHLLRFSFSNQRTPPK